MKLLKEINQNIVSFISEAEILLNSLSQQLHEDIEWEPQPEWRGARGKTKETGAGMQQRRQQEMRAKVQKIQQAYLNAVKSLKTAPMTKKPAIQNVITKLEAIAKKNNIRLPQPQETEKSTLGLAPS